MNNPENQPIPVSQAVSAGAAVYSKAVLFIYDVEVLMFEIPFIFKCPLRAILDFYNENISQVHLDVGVGSGYFLDKCHFPVGNPIVHLMDLNLNSLEKTAKRIKRYDPVAHHWNVLEPFNNGLPRFNSISASNFLHCLPGTMLDKEVVFKNLKPLLTDGGVIFGTTILGQNIDVGLLYKIVNTVYNKQSIFCNLNDNVVDLECILARNFRQYTIRRMGSVVFFTGTR